MKRILFLALFVFVAGVFSSQAQHVKVRLDFPVGISINPNGHPPYRDAVWVGPEWQWRHGRYVSVPGHWVHPRHRGAVWVPGHWVTEPHGEIWVSGRWR